MRCTRTLTAIPSIVVPGSRHQFLHVLGIESSCDDSAVAIVNSDKRRILADRRSADSESLLRLGGVLPYASARHHRSALGPLIEKALDDADLRSSDIDAVAVSTRPGLVYCLKVGVEHALAFARCFRRPLVSVHHLRAHSLVARLLNPRLSFPFLSLIASGAHCLICSVHGPNQFHILADSVGGSPGECLDKLAREMGLVPYKGSFAAQIEQMAKKCPPDEVGRFALPLWSFGEQMDFNAIKCRYLRLLHRGNKRPNKETELAAWCAGIQHTVTQLVCQHLDSALAFFASTNPHTQCHLVVAGGVAANEYFREQVKNIAALRNFPDVIMLPRELCTDNGVMVAWTGVEILTQALNKNVGKEKMDEEEKRHGREEEVETEEESAIYWHTPDSLLVSPRSRIGPSFENFPNKRICRHKNACTLKNE